MAEYPKFKEKLQDKYIGPVMQQAQQPCYALVFDYNSIRNTATILTAQPGSDQPGEIYKEIDCPVTLGVQGVAPRAGMMCLIAFRDGTFTNPYIVNFFNPHFNKFNYTSQYTASSGVPSYMLYM